MRILVTGANGFIGSYITAALLKSNYEVVCAVRDIESTRKNFLLQKLYIVILIQLLALKIG